MIRIATHGKTTAHALAPTTYEKFIKRRAETYTLYAQICGDSEPPEKLRKRHDKPRALNRTLDRAQAVLNRPGG